MTDAQKLPTRRDISDAVDYGKYRLIIDEYIPALFDALEAAQSELAKAAAERNDIQSKFTELKWAYNKSLERERVLREALTPFTRTPDFRVLSVACWHADYRRARAALATDTDTKGNRND